MSIANTTAPHSVKPSTVRVRRYRDRRQKGICCLTVEMPKAVIEEAIADGGLKPDYDTWDVLDAYYADVLDAYYADHLSEAALDWLIKNKVIKHEQRGDAAAILSGISDWLERAQNE